MQSSDLNKQESSIQQKFFYKIVKKDIVIIFGIILLILIFFRALFIYLPIYQSLDRKFIPGSELVINGNFQQDWEVGWSSRIGIEVERDLAINVVETSYESFNSNRSVLLANEGYGDVFILQTVEIPHANVLFSASLFTSVQQGNCEDCDVHAGMILSFYDDQKNAVANFLYLNDADIDSSTYTASISDDSLYAITISGETSININIKDHIQSKLLNVDINSIRKVSIIIFATADYCKKESGCKSSIAVSDVSLKVPQN